MEALYSDRLAGDGGAEPHAQVARWHRVRLGEHGIIVLEHDKEMMGQQDLLHDMQGIH